MKLLEYTRIVWKNAAHKEIKTANAKHWIIVLCQANETFFKIIPSIQAPLSVWDCGLVFHLAVEWAVFSGTVFGFRCLGVGCLKKKTNMRSNKQPRKKGHAKMFPKLSALLQDYRQTALFCLCSRTWKVWNKEYGVLSKMKSGGTATACVLQEQGEIHSYMHQSPFAAGPSRGYYVA